VREFETGATRDNDTNKLDYEGFLSPVVLEAFAGYMHKHRKQADGKLRASDNWQKGMPRSVYLKSAFRHFMDLWKLHRGYSAIDRSTGKPVDEAEACCALMFNVMGYLHSMLTEMPESCDPLDNIVPFPSITLSDRELAGPMMTLDLEVPENEKEREAFWADTSDVIRDIAHRLVPYQRATADDWMMRQAREKASKL